MIKCISGVYSPDEGEIYVEGQRALIHNPRDAAAAGIATVYQDLALVDSRDVAANIFLGREFTYGRGIFVNRSKGLEEAKKALATLRADIPSVRVMVGQLSGGQRQAVAIARAIAQGGKIFIMDEPTAALGVAESREVLRLVAELKEQGASVIVISHNLQHVFSVADRITVMRHGQIVGSPRKGETTMEEIVQMIVGARTAA